MTSDGAVLDERQRVTLARVAAVLIPGGEGMPSAAELDVAGELVDRVLALRPMASAGLPALLDRLAEAAGDPGAVGDVLRRSRAEEPAAFGLLSSVVVGAYFLDETARASIGYPGQGPLDATFEDETGYIAEGLLDPVLQREGSARGT